MNNKNIIFLLEGFIGLIGPVVSLISVGYLLFYAPYVGTFIRNIRDFGDNHQPLGLIFFIIFFILFFILFTAMVFPLAVKLDKSKETLKDIYSAAIVAFGPWIDVLLKIINDDFSVINIDRVCLLYLGIGVFAMIFAAIKVKNPLILLIGGIAFFGFILYYTGLWISGGMGNLKDIIIWHATMIYVAYLSYKEWLKLVIDVDSEDIKNEKIKK